MGAWGFRLAAIAVACLLLYFVPLIHITAITASDTIASFDAAEIANAFWEERLIPASADAASATQVAAALSEDVAKAGNQHGRRVGVSRGFLLFVQGVGAVQSADDRGVLVQLDGGGEVRLSKKKVFGATIRDATGLLSNDEVPGSREYNEVASEINRLAAERAGAALAKVATGDRLRFAGCAKITSPTAYTPPLEVIPVLLEAAK